MSRAAPALSTLPLSACAAPAMAAATAAATSASRGSVVAAIATGNRGGITTALGQRPRRRAAAAPTASIDSGSGVAHR